MKNFISLNKFIVFILLLGCNILAAQKEDYVWLTGQRIAENKPDTGIHKKFGFTKFDFSSNTMVRELSNSGYSHTNTAISDKNGIYLFSTNGTRILDRNHNIMQNGDSINAGYLQFEWDSTMKKDGYRTMQGAIILPIPDNDSLYYVLHLLKDSSRDNSIQLYDSKLLHTLVNIRANNGLGKVVYKDSLLIKDTFSYFIAACKKANGRDWWIFTLDANTEYMHKLSLTKTGLKIEGREKLGKVNKLDLYQASFSPDGKKFILFQALYGLSIFDFDRCKGGFSNPRYCPIPEVKDSTWYGLGISISPNSRFAYATVTKRIFQYDLWASNIPTSKETVASYDGYYDEFILFKTLFNVPQLAPNGKIYISTGNSTRYLHVIDKPDEKGLACNVIQHGHQLLTKNGSIPYFPHFRMAADSSSCTSGIEESKQLSIKIYPNPASDYIEVISPDNYRERAVGSEIVLHNILGQQFYPRIEITKQGLRIDVRELPLGIYFLYMTDKDTILSRTEKFVIQR